MQHLEKCEAHAACLAPGTTFSIEWTEIYLVSLTLSTLVRVVAAR